MVMNILVVFTSRDKLEFTHSWKYFQEANAIVTVASPSGGLAPPDPNSTKIPKEDLLSTSFSGEQKGHWENILTIPSVLGKPGDFDVVFSPGGHGPVYDLANDAASQQVIAESWDGGKIVAAVCHESAALANVKLTNGNLLLKGKMLKPFGEKAAVDGRLNTDQNPASAE
ncbi:DJ-1/PfpI family protein [Hypoxylon sp. FL1150]|nr:DJ-1/PfpI family protein [Hypoxylon sp. FL1150]